MLGSTGVVLNAPATRMPESDDAGRIVAVARDADGTVRLQQRDGAVREVSPEGRIAIRSGAAAAMQGDLPPSMIVAVDAANTVHIVDPDACTARTISPQGRVATTLLSLPSAHRSCNPGTARR